MLGRLLDQERDEECLFEYMFLVDYSFCGIGFGDRM